MRFSLKALGGFKKGFTIVELAAVIAVIGILTSIVIVSYGSWQRGIAEDAAKSSLQSLDGAMTQTRNFSNGYPSTVPTSFQEDENVGVEYVTGNIRGYCAEAQSADFDEIIWHIEVRGSSSEIAEGPCPSDFDPDEIGGSELDSGWKDVALNNSFSCGVSFDDLIYCWGYGATSPVALGQGGIPSGATISSITGGASHLCAVANGWAYCWGDNTNGRLGDGTTTTRSTPTAIVRGAIPTGVTILRVAAGGNHTCALGSNGAAYCWGYNADGQLGRGNTTASNTPVAVAQGARPAGVTFTKLDAGGTNGCGIGSNGVLYCWGNGSVGEIGDGSNSDRTSPVAVSQGAIPGGSTIDKITVGGNHTCALITTGAAYCWGSGVNGRLGNNSSSNSNIPVAVTQSGVAYKQIKAGGTFSCATSVDGSGYCWGYNASGQLGLGHQVNWHTPAAISDGAVPAAAQIQLIKAGNETACAISSQNIAYCVGSNSGGLIGDGTTTNRSQMVQVGLIP